MTWLCRYTAYNGLWVQSQECANQLLLSSVLAPSLVVPTPFLVYPWLPSLPLRPHPLSRMPVSSVPHNGPLKSRLIRGPFTLQVHRSGIRGTSYLLFFLIRKCSVVAGGEGRWLRLREEGLAGDTSSSCYRVLAKVPYIYIVPLR